jgi:hypothetical protein
MIMDETVESPKTNPIFNYLLKTDEASFRQIHTEASFTLSLIGIIRGKINSQVLSVVISYYAADQNNANISSHAYNFV